MSYRSAFGCHLMSIVKWSATQHVDLYGRGFVSNSTFEPFVVGNPDVQAIR